MKFYSGDYSHILINILKVIINGIQVYNSLMMPNKMKMKLSFALLSLKLDIIEISRHTSSWHILCENYALVSLSTLLSTMKGNTSSWPLLLAFLYDDQLGKNFFVISKRSRKRWKERLNLLSPSLKMRIDDLSYSNFWFHRPKSINTIKKTWMSMGSC